MTSTSIVRDAVLEAIRKAITELREQLRELKNIVKELEPSKKNEDDRQNRDPEDGAA